MLSSRVVFARVPLLARPMATASGKKPAKPKLPKRAPSPYNLFVKDAIQERPASIMPAECMAKAASQWKMMSGVDKAPYETAAAEARENFEALKKEHAKPLRFRTAYVFFTKENHCDVSSEMPSRPFGDIGAEIGRRWKLLSDSARQPYLDMEQADRARWERETAAHAKKQ
eukprot:scpid26432/ scgid12249/ Non-histone chromosomal protein 6